MKTLLTALASTASLTRRLVSACRRKPDVRPAARARLVVRRARTAAGFATVIVFETICA